MQRLDYVVLLSLGFHAMLRTEEVLSVRTFQFTLNASEIGVLALPWTKTGGRRGQQEMVTIDDGHVGRLILALIKLIPAGETLLRGNSQQFRTFFSQAAAVLKVGYVNYRPYSLRRGGATHDFVHHKSLGRTVVRGRWSHQRVSRIYIQDGMAVQTQLQLPPEVRALVTRHMQI